ncbi:ZIP family metal transporter [Kineococcus rubinsiae]|uniref:ZIP family metal transporter n=1 Tax=Kineococcus rubinsiae TaxID=2609562 RepID=UPI00142FF161|nr:ZIP family metal transporter [Kineococcus rubinsiae]NIZ92282.1 zinc permease [Kineococcus rubinsiae]
MSLSSTLVLGLIAGGTILLGLPLGRLRRPAPGLRVLLNATAIGVLLFLLWDVLSAAWEPLDAALGALGQGEGGAGPAVGYGALFAVGLAAGMFALVGYEAWMRSRSAPSARRFGPGAMTAGELRGSTTPPAVAGSPARQLAFLIAVGIGLHNFAEGLAIGQSAATGEIALATLLVVGFALHNATEGFGIVAPLAAEGERPSWALLALLGLIGGGPTFVGAALGHGFTSEPVSVAFLTLAAGSILYVVVQLMPLAAKAKRPTLLGCGLLLGLLAGFATDAVVTAAGV